MKIPLVNKNTGKNFGYFNSWRKQWIEDRILHLTGIFCIDVAAYAVMSNHFHVITKSLANKAKQLSEREVIERWHHLFRGNELTRSYLKDDFLTEPEANFVQSCANKWRVRLYDISWFMRCINEPIARLANKEDGCTGRFWKGIECDFNFKNYLSFAEME